MSYPTDFPTFDAEKNAKARTITRYIMILLLAADVITLVFVKHFGVINPLAGAIMFLLNTNVVPLFYIFFLYCHWNKVWDVVRLTLVGMAGHTAVSMYCGIVKIMANEGVMIIVGTIFKFASVVVFALVLSMTIRVIIGYKAEE